MTDQLSRLAGHGLSWTCLGAVLLFLLSASSRGDEWPQFMGPNGTGFSAEKGLAKAWPAGGAKELWTVPLRPGYGGASIFEGSVYVLDRVDRQKDVLRVLDLATGKEKWT